MKTKILDKRSPKLSKDSKILLNELNLFRRYRDKYADHKEVATVLGEINDCLNKVAGFSQKKTFRRYEKSLFHPVGKLVSGIDKVVDEMAFQFNGFSFVPVSGHSIAAISWARVAALLRDAARLGNPYKQMKRLHVCENEHCRDFFFGALNAKYCDKEVCRKAHNRDRVYRSR